MTSSVALRVGLVSACAIGLALACSGKSTGNSVTRGGSGANRSGGGGSGIVTNPTAGAGVILSDASTGKGDEGCNDLHVKPTKVTPTVLLLVDTSSSMFQPRTQLWDPLFSALMDPTTGVVKKLQDQVRFGFTSYNDVTQPAGDPQCPKLTSVDFSLNNYDAINKVYMNAGVTPTGNFKWETPTGESIAKVTETLKAYAPMPAGPKYILLVTDGNPDTCAVRDPQCGEDASIKATQDAFAAGIGTFVIGIGDILVNNDGCVGRCGKDHLQDIANAGKGLPVAANSIENAYQQCTAGPSGVKGKYVDADAGEVPGSAPYYTASNPTDLTAAISGLLNGVASCTFEMDAIVTGDASEGTVMVGSTLETYNDPNGWKLEADMTSVTLLGTACTSLQTGTEALSISFPCAVAMPK